MEDPKGEGGLWASVTNQISKVAETIGDTVQNVKNSLKGESGPPTGTSPTGGSKRRRRLLKKSVKKSAKKKVKKNKKKGKSKKKSRRM